MNPIVYAEVLPSPSATSALSGGSIFQTPLGDFICIPTHRYSRESPWAIDRFIIREESNGNFITDPVCILGITSFEWAKPNKGIPLAPFTVVGNFDHAVWITSPHITFEEDTFLGLTDTALTSGACIYFRLDAPLMSCFQKYALKLANFNITLTDNEIAVNDHVYFKVDRENASIIIDLNTDLDVHPYLYSQKKDRQRGLVSEEKKIERSSKISLSVASSQRLIFSLKSPEDSFYFTITPEGKFHFLILPTTNP